MNIPILSVGIASIIAAIVGGGMKALGVEIPAIESARRQQILAAFGVCLIIAAIYVDQPNPKIGDSGAHKPDPPAVQQPVKPQADGEKTVTLALDQPDPTVPIWNDSVNRRMWWKAKISTSEDVASSFCDDHIFSAHSDWHLPSYQDVNLLFDQTKARAEIAHDGEAIWIQRTMARPGEYSSIYVVPSQRGFGDKTAVLLCVRSY